MDQIVKNLEKAKGDRGLSRLDENTWNRRLNPSAHVRDAVGARMPAGGAK